MAQRRSASSEESPVAKRGAIWATPCRPCAGRMIKHPGHVCRGQGDKSAKCTHCVAGHHKCEDLLVDQDGKIKPAARAVAAASLRISRGEEVMDYEALATKYNLLARREAKRRPAAAGVSGPTGTATETIATLLRQQIDLLLDIRSELSAIRKRSGAQVPPSQGSEDGETQGLSLDGSSRGPDETSHEVSDY